MKINFKGGGGGGGGGGGESSGPETVQYEFHWVCAAEILNTKPKSDFIFYV